MDKKTLYRLFYLPKQIEQKKREIQRIQERLESISPNLSGMPHGGGVHDKLGEGVPELVDKKRELEEMIRSFQREEDAINDWIDGIDDLQIQLMVSLRFRERMSWTQVADEAGGGIVTDDSCRKMIDRYLEKGDALDGPKRRDQGRAADLQHMEDRSGGKQRQGLPELPVQGSGGPVRDELRRNSDEGRQRAD
jgi:hypothetical protein